MMGDEKSAAPLVIVGCGATKQAHAAPAGEMYLGSYHRACRKVAAALTSPDRVLILSALHGLLALDDVIDPYDLRMGQPGAVGAETVHDQAEARGLLDAESVVVLAGTAYVDVATAVWAHAHTPLKGVGGMGKQLAALAAMADDPARALPYQPPTPGRALLTPGQRVESIPEASPKTGGRYGGALVSIGALTAVVNCDDGIQRRFPNEHLKVWPARILTDAWRALGYIDPTTRRPTTDDWEWLAWTLVDHLAYDDETRSAGWVGPSAASA